MKLFIAYILVVIGIPYFVGLLFGKVATLPLAIIVGLFRKPIVEDAQATAVANALHWTHKGAVKMPIADRVLHVCMDAFNGFGASVTAGFIFHLFKSPPTFAVPCILAGWELIFTVGCGQSYRALFSTLAGIAIGWLFVLAFFSI